jgi:hypothetical protein
MTFKPSIRSTFTSVVKGHIVILLLGGSSVLPGFALGFCLHV